MKDVETTIEKFRQTGLKITPQRISIFNLLKDDREHPSAEDIYKRVLKIHPSISFTTVYKTLQTLRDMDEIRELSINPERVHYDPATDDHIHTFCTVCRNIEDFMPDHSCEYLELASSKINGFHVQSAEVYLTGICEDCSV